MEDLIYKWALKNAIEHDGKAIAGAVIPKVIGEDLSLKDKIKELGKKTAEIVKRVNQMSLEEQKKELEKIDASLLEKQKKETKLPELPNAIEGKVVMMFPPEPSKFPHLGHAKAAYLNYYYSQKYKGRFILRMEDTDYRKVKQEYYDAMINDLTWLGLKWEKVDYISDYIEEMYADAEKLIKEDHAYMCNCTQEEISKNRRNKKECACRNRTIEENMKLWKEMLKGKYQKGEYVLRLKIDMAHKNDIMRDPAIFRVHMGHHVRVGDKYKVWPMYDIATVIMNRIEGITHRCRGKEFELHAELQDKISEYLNIKSPIVLEFARTTIKDCPLAGRIIRDGIANGTYLGWDDPRLGTIRALRRRGFQPEAIRNFIIRMGFSKHNAVIGWDIIEAENRKVIDPIANRYMAIFNPVELILTEVPKNFKAILNYHPDFPERGYREYEIKEGEKLFVEENDVKGIKKGKLIRLMNLGDVIIEKVSKNSITAKLTKNEENPEKIIHWILAERNFPLEIIMDDASIKKGLIEMDVQKLKENDIIQLIRFGFCRVDSNPQKDIKLRYTHK